MAAEASRVGKVSKSTGKSADTSKGKGRSNKTAPSKTWRSTRASGSSTSSGNQDSGTQGSARQTLSEEPATQDLAAPDSLTGIPDQESAARDALSQTSTPLDSETGTSAAQGSAVHESAAAGAATPVKGQQARPANDLDKLLGSRLKSVRPQAEFRQAEEPAASPVAALRGQLRRVKLEPEDASSPSREGLREITGQLTASSPQVCSSSSVILDIAPCPSTAVPWLPSYADLNLFKHCPIGIDTKSSTVMDDGSHVAGM